MLLLNSFHGSIARDKMAVTMAMTGDTELIRLIGSFRPERYQQLNNLVIKDRQ